MQAHLNAKIRNLSGKSAIRKIRGMGFVPAVVYGPSRDTVSIVLDERKTERLISTSGIRKIYDLNIEDGDNRTDCQVMFKDIQRDSLSGKIKHIDFYEIQKGRKLTVVVPIELVGEPFGVSEHGGVLQFLIREVPIECLPKDLPELFKLDVSPLDIGQGVTLRDLQLPDYIECLEDLDKVVASAVAVKSEDLAAEEEDEDSEAAEAGSEESVDEESE